MANQEMPERDHKAVGTLAADSPMTQGNAPEKSEVEESEGKQK